MRRDDVTMARSAQARGLEAFARRDFAAAASAFDEAIQQRPRDPSLRLQLGAALRGLGDPAAAIASYRHALTLPADESRPAIHNNLGNALRSAGDLSGSLEQLEAAVSIKPDYPEAWHNLALTLSRLEKNERAEAALVKAIGLRRDYAEAHALLGQLFALRGDFAAAVAAGRQATALQPGSAEYHLQLASALQGCGRFEDAEAAVEAAARLEPDNANVVFALAREREQRGEREGSAAAYRQVIAVDPRHATAHLSLANGAGLSDEELAAAERVAAVPDLPSEERSTFAFAIARSHEQRKDYDRAFEWARFGNMIEAAKSPFDEKQAEAFINRSIRTFTRDSFDTGATGSSDERPVFIVGFPRSGTSLVEQIVASHPLAAAGGELVEIPDVVKELPEPYPDRVPFLGQEATDAIVRRYRDRLDRIDRRAIRITDKLPFNFRNLGLIARLFPGARIIHCRRDPRDIAVSCYFIKFHRPISFAQNLFHFGAYWRMHLRLMEHWKKVLPIPILAVDYEAIVADPEAEIRRIIGFSRLPFDERCLRFYETRSVVRTASVNQIRNPIYSASVGRWRHYARHLAPLLSELEKPDRPRQWDISVTRIPAAGPAAPEPQAESSEAGQAA